MTQRLPVPGGDDGNWGDILNGFLEVSLNADGTLQTAALTQAGGEVTGNKGAASGYAPLNSSSLVPTTNLGTGTASSSNYLRGDGTWVTPNGGSSSLASDSDVTISSPANNQVLTYNSGAGKWENVAPAVASVDGLTGAVPGLLQSSNNLSDLASTATARTNLGLGSAATENIGTSSGTVMAGNQAAGGDLSGTLPSPTVAKVNGVAVTGTPSTGQVITATSGTAASWSTPSGGVTLDTNASDIQALGSQSAGSIGKAADSGHIHPITGVVATSEVGAASGVASLDGSALIPSAQFGNPITATLEDKGGQVFSVKAYGAKGNGSTDDTTAIQAAITAAESANGMVYLSAGTYNVSSSLNITQDIAFVGIGDGSLIVATASMTQVLNITVGGAGRGVFQDFRVNGNSLATNCINQSIVSETSVGTRYVRVRCSGATSYQFVDYQCEDVSYMDCTVDGNESAPNSTPYALQVVVPFGAIRIFGGEWFGRCDLSYQEIGVYSSVIGPIYIENSSAYNDTVLYLSSCYVYDGGPNHDNCINTGTNLTNIVLDACYLVAQSENDWINGNIPAYVSIEARNCIWVHGSAGSVGACSILQASGSGVLSVIGGSASLLSGDTISLFTPVSSATTIIRMPIQCISVPAYSTALASPSVPSTGVAQTNSFATTVTVYVSGGSVSVIQVGSVVTGLTSGAISVPPSQTITLTYASAPTWAWFAS